MSKRWSMAMVMLLALGAAAGAWAAVEGTTDTGTDDARLAQDAQSAPVVRLTDPGAEPRRPLRYQFAAGQTETMNMEMRMRMGMTMGAQTIPEMELPAMVMAMNVNITEVAPDGSYRYEFSVTSADIANPDQVDPMTASQMRGQLAGMVGLSGWARVDARGFTLEGDINAPATVDPAVQQLMQSLEQSIQQLSAPLPEEPVGAGATWEVVTVMAPSGFQLEQTAQMTLAEITGDTMRIDASIRQTAASQPLNAPGMPAGAEATLNFLESTGSGTMNVDLHRVVPSSQMSLSTHMMSSVSLGGQSETVTMDMNLDLTVTPGE